jgi:hypothetical protein
MANQNEYLFYKENFENPLLIPTYFSFFGLINIQLLGKPLQNSSLYIFHEIDCLVKESKEITKIEPHQWTEKNFVEFSNKTIALCDYGSLQAFAIIEKYGDDIVISVMHFDILCSQSRNTVVVARQIQWNTNS